MKNAILAPALSARRKQKHNDPGALVVRPDNTKARDEDIREIHEGGLPASQAASEV